jgi:asparagine synthase (glutamine-hydrolysing)
MEGFAAATERYAYDGTFLHIDGNVGMGFQPNHTHQRSTADTQPLVDALGNMLSFDGRLDNWKELLGQLNLLDRSASDSAIVLAAFSKWGEYCFSKFVGDWALALWCAASHRTYLARDHAGTRTLYFSISADTLQWSTHLEMFFALERTRAIDERFVACFLANRCHANLTPYRDIQVVPPAHYVVVAEGKALIVKHWDSLACEVVHYNSDGEYEEHFISLFKQSIVRRTSKGDPVLAQLSGGIDSTSIVCVSDLIRKAEDPAAELIDTVSFYDDDEPNWNEKPFFGAVEASRRKLGLHVGISTMSSIVKPLSPSQGTYLVPGGDSNSLEKKLHELVEPNRYRVILSGIGGDEVLGGVPIPFPELADYLVSGNLRLLLKQATAWSLETRKPLVYTLFGTVRFLGTLYSDILPSQQQSVPWLTPQLRKLCTERHRPAGTWIGRLRSSPSAISNATALETVTNSMPHLHPEILARYEYRYPYLDRDLLEFLFRVPTTQLLRPGRRRSLMRRALKGIVPTEILERRRKAFLIRGPLAAIRANRVAIEALFADSLLARYGFLEANRLRESLDLTAAGIDTRWRHGVAAAICLELWLRSNDAKLHL